ncbi:MAG: hypothetical protein V5A68_07195 [Candidatus Thermoplasmatota archaeon]
MKDAPLLGVCGKKKNVAELQDLYIHLMEGLAVCNIERKKQGDKTDKVDDFITEGLFSTITNVNFDKNYFLEKNR